MGRIIGKAVIVAAMACPVLFTSCDKFIYDDSQLKESIEDLNKRLTALCKHLCTDFCCKHAGYSLDSIDYDRGKY